LCDGVLFAHGVIDAGLRPAMPPRFLTSLDCAQAVRGFAASGECTGRGQLNSRESVGANDHSYVSGVTGNGRARDLRGLGGLPCPERKFAVLPAQVMNLALAGRQHGSVEGNLPVPSHTGNSGPASPKTQQF
jgi:hypothetical protein